MRRIGQQSATVTSIWISGFVVDEKLDKLLQSKDKSCQLVLNQAPSTGSCDSSGVTRNWFKDASVTLDVSSKPKAESSKIKGVLAISNYFQTQAKVGTNQSSNNNPIVIETANLTKEMELADRHWNVNESEEEQEHTTRSIMSDLLTDIL